MTKAKTIFTRILSLLLVISLISFPSNVNISSASGTKAPATSNNYIKRVVDPLNFDMSDYFDPSIVTRLTDKAAEEEEISVIVTMNVKSVIEAYNELDTTMTVSEYAATKEAKAVVAKVTDERIKLLGMLNYSGINYSFGNKYATVMSGFAINIAPSDFDAVNALFKNHARVVVGEVYEETKFEVVENKVDVYGTGIFDSSSSPYQGDGVVVAVLDTGLDYTHTAFSPDANHFNTSNEAFTLASVSEKVDSTVAASFTPGLTGEDVYLNRKVPFAYDYADMDPDVLPINSEHGTHVAGVIAGNDDVITGVAPNAQLAIMKVFSDARTGAPSYAILAALEDCVTLGVDVVNMSLGSPCGFSRLVDGDADQYNDMLGVTENAVYDSIKDAGISLVIAAGNEYNATKGSEKNGSLALTSNPDDGTVGSPGSYDAPLTVASVDGVKTPYITYNGDIMYFIEASTSGAETKHFVDDILSTVGENVDSYDFEYVTIPGVGRSSDYIGEKEDYEGKIVLVKRGDTTFEDKVRVALKEKGASGIIIYNNVSGDISMSVGASVGAVCSISQDEGEKLAAAETGVLHISRDQVAGPFMSAFSSWGPTSDLHIKPEITAHGGEILSAIPGQDYDRLSGTSMAAPNQAGATALIRQYVKYSGVFGEDVTPQQVTAYVNQLMMSTADTVLNKNGLPYAVRKQGSGLVNITKAMNSSAYIATYDKDGNVMDKTKLELGDDAKKTGVYHMTFDICNITGSVVTYDIGGIVMTEGVSTTYTSHSETTVTQDGYLLGGAFEVTGVEGGTQGAGNLVTVGARQSAQVTVVLTLTDNDKKYLDDSFENGMYVEGFLKFAAKSGATVDMSVPFLAFYGDWLQAPVFDEEFYDTNVDELNKGLDPEDKLMADAYATRVIGGLYSDWIGTLGAYYYVQDPSVTPIAASKEHIAISNQKTDTNKTLNTVRYVSAGMLRNAKEVKISIIEDATGKEVFSRTEYNQRKSYGIGTIYGSSFDVEFSAIEQNLKNNTRYTVNVEAFVDYGTHEDQSEVNKRNVFSFPVYIDFQAPVITGVQYRTEYDRTTKKTKLYADLSVYDNHYAMAMFLEQIVPSEEEGYLFSIRSFGKYATPIYSEFNSTSTVTLELTDYIAQLKDSIGISYDEEGNVVPVKNNSFLITVLDYAQNRADYEIRLPDEILSMQFEEDVITLNPNETRDITELLSIYPDSSWLQVLDFVSSDPEIFDVVNQTVIAKKSGTATLTAIGTGANSNVSASVEIKVLGEGDEGYNGNYDVPEVNKFNLDGYETTKAFYNASNDEREIGVTGSINQFGNEFVLSMFPSERVALTYTLDSYFPEATAVTFSAGNSKVATVSETGEITAMAKGTTIVTATVTFNGKRTRYSGQVRITVKDPFTTSAIYLTNYRGLGGVVEIPDDRGITTINSYAFSQYEWVEKDLNGGDTITREDPYYIKQMYIGDDTITKVIIPEGVTEIQSYAFANLTALEEVVLPKSLVRIGVGAFYGCKSLKKINLEYAKFINGSAFQGCALEEIDLSSVVSIGTYTFANNNLNYIVLPESSQSLGNGAFANNTYLNSVEFKASKIKIGSAVFAGCGNLTSVDINAAVISSYAFNGCETLKSVNLGKDVSIIGEFAFAGTDVSAFTVDGANTALTAKENGAMLYKGDELVLVAPKYSGKANTVTTDAKSIGAGAFSGNIKVYSVIANNVTTIGNYAFAGCTNLRSAKIDNVTQIGDYAFALTQIGGDLSFKSVTKIGVRAYMQTKISSVTLGDGVEIGDYAFAFCTSLEKVTVGNDVTIGEGAFYCQVYMFDYSRTGSTNYYDVYNYDVLDEEGNVVDTYSYLRYNFTSGVTSMLKSLSIGNNAIIGEYAFFGLARLKSISLGDCATIMDYAFTNAASLTEIDLSTAKYVGDSAFSGTSINDLWRHDNMLSYAYEFTMIDGELVASRYMTSSFAPKLTSVDLSSATYIGSGAFSGNKELSSVKIGSVTQLSDYAFANCTSLTEFDFSGITAVGSYTFYGTKIANADLSDIDEIGDYAFANGALESVVLKDGVIIGDDAFYYNFDLKNVENLDKAVYIGAQAFARTALSEATLTEARYIGDYAFVGSALNTVVFGDKLVALGENPFLSCAIATFGKENEVVFGGETVGFELLETYDISETVKVIDGVLYQSVPNGKMELISYPLLKSDEGYVVAEGTSRISAYAFAGSGIKNVTLPWSLKSIGAMAFYSCDDLRVVVFKSLDAPALEEEYSESHLTYQELPFTGRLGEYEGLGIVDFYMWNITSHFNNFYFGANFVDYIGHVAGDLVMVKPVNGNNYDSFILSQYFGEAIDGSSAATDETAEVIELIASLPANITLAAKEQVAEARAAYGMIATMEQQALVTNYNVLTRAESTITYLESIAKPEDPVKPNNPDDPGNEVSGGCNCSAENTASLPAMALMLLPLAFVLYVGKRK